MAARITKTINPLPFEHLEPHRFEDLVRQLTYDFRNWNKLEATGRGGSDDGFDVRGWEIVTENTPNDGDESGEEQTNKIHDRVWLIQCKREKAINPMKLEKYLAATPLTNLHGIIFAAACDFSKKSRDKFNEICRAAGLVEFHLWGKAELEDKLYQPKHDNLLFAYFGISLLIRQRSKKTEINSILSVKRKVEKHLGPNSQNTHKLVLIRDVNDTNYPCKEKIKDFEKNAPWRLYYYEGYDHLGIKLKFADFFAYVWDDKIHWDYIKVNAARPNEDPWAGRKNNDEYNKWHRYWLQYPDDNKAWLGITGIIPFSNIIAIDELGDDNTGQFFEQVPHIYISTQPDGSFFEYYQDNIRTLSRPPRYLKPRKKTRKIFFPEIPPDVIPSVNQ